MAAYIWLALFGLVLASVGLFQILRNGALGVPSIHPEMRAAQRRGRWLFAIGQTLFLIGHVLKLRH